jgi:hypothetical protein
MPAWPTQSDYKDALQNPDTAFRDPDLQASQAERSPMGVPRARSGAFASVYKMSRGPKSIALKLFNFPNEDRASRYQAVSDYLKSLGPKKPGSMVAFEYHPEGIRVGKGWYPTLTMEWVKGKALGEWVREAMEKKTPDTAAVRAMADAWAQLVLDIRSADIAHGDLQHDNVMVVGNTLVLVDYDGMCVPALAPGDPNKKLEQLEFGKPAYQHPGRPGEKLGLHLDHFAAWVILIALRATVADPALYTRFVTKTANENLLFTPPDMLYSTSSALWTELLKCKDPEVRDWSKNLRACLDKPFEQIPQFSLDPFVVLRKLVASVPRDWAAIAAESDRLAKAGKRLTPDLASAADPVGRLMELCKAVRKDYVAIATESDALIRSGKTVPTDLRPIAADAVKRVNCRDSVQHALEAGDPRAVKAAFQKPLLDGWADKRLIADAETAVAQVDVLDMLKKAVATPGDGRALVKLWMSEGHKVAGLSEAAAYENDAKTWDAQLTAAETFINLYRIGATEQALANAWEKVTDAGEHSDLKPEHRTRGEEAQRRAPLLAKLAGVPPAASYKNDSAFLAAWGDGSSLSGCKEADRYIPHINTARDRLNKVAALKRAIEAADAGTGTEAGIVDAAKPLAGYEHPYADRVILGKKSVAALVALKTAVDEKPPSDRAIAAALDELRTTNVELLARLDKVDAVLAAEATAAGRRRKALNEFAELDRKYSEPDKQDRKWQALWLKHKELLHGRHDTEELRDRLTLAVNRTRACEALLAALDAREMFKLRELHEKYSDRLRGYPPVLERKAELNELLTKADRVIEIQKKLEIQAVMLSEVDLQFLRENHNAFRKSDRETIVALVTNKLKTDAKLIAGRPQVKVVPNGRAVAVTACWAWAGYGLVSHCLVAVDRNKHLTSPSEADQYGLLKCQLRDHTGEGGGKRVAPPRGANKVFITVWTVVELGWTTVYGPPLHLGPAAVTPQW